MGLPIVSGAGSEVLTIDPTSNAARTTLYGPNGQVLSLPDTGTFQQGSGAGVMVEGHDGPVARAMRVSSTGALRGGNDSPPIFVDSTEGAAVDVNKWLQTTTTMTITQAASTGTLYNSASTLTTTTGAMQTTIARFPVAARNAILIRQRARMSAHANNNLVELGFGAPATATTASIGDGACWRKDGTGQWVPVISVAGAEALGTPVSNETFRDSIAVTDYAIFEVFLEDTRATFRIFTTAGALVNEQYVPFGTTIGTFAVTAVAGFARTYNAGAVATAVQLWTSLTAVWYTDQNGPDFRQTPLWMGNGSLTSPTAYTQLANYTVNVGVVNGTPGTATAAYNTLGGLFRFAAIAGAASDLAVFAFQIPASKGFTVERVTIDTFNDGAAVATTATVLQWGLGFNSTAQSLLTAAPGAPMKKTIGQQAWAIGAAVGAPASTVVWRGREKVQPGRWFHVIIRPILGTATASQFLSGTCSVDGFFE